MRPKNTKYDLFTQFLSTTKHTEFQTFAHIFLKIIYFAPSLHYWIDLLPCTLQNKMLYQKSLDIHHFCTSKLTFSFPFPSLFFSYSFIRLPHYKEMISNSITHITNSYHPLPHCEGQNEERYKKNLRIE